MIIQIKYIVDWVVSLFLFVFLFPLGLLIALAIKLDDGGPIFFRQVRSGYLEKHFRVWKFRTMIIDADRLLGPDGLPVGNRVTRVGRFLRLTSLDEVPQVMNILFGEMSLVGPRPILPSMADRLDSSQKKRFFMRPGVTGLAQVKGRNSILVSRRIAYDVEYVDQFSLLLDIKILFQTILVVFTSSGVAVDRLPGNDDLPKDSKSVL
ncbi:putative sugar transferase EpsL [Gammaproteobacteria bacterium]